MNYYDSPFPFAPLSPTEALLRYGDTCRERGAHFERDGLCERWREAARDEEALRWRVHLALKASA